MVGRPALGEVTFFQNVIFPALGRVVFFKNAVRPALGRLTFFKKAVPTALGKVVFFKNVIFPALGKVAFFKKLVRRTLPRVTFGTRLAPERLPSVPFCLTWPWGCFREPYLNWGRGQEQSWRKKARFVRPREPGKKGCLQNLARRPRRIAQEPRRKKKNFAFSLRPSRSSREKRDPPPPRGCLGPRPNGRWQEGRVQWGWGVNSPKKFALGALEPLPPGPGTRPTPCRPGALTGRPEAKKADGEAQRFVNRA